MAAKPPPTIDFSPVYSTDEAAQRQVIEQIRQACLEHGFFQLINHGVPSELVDGILAQSDKLFDLPHDVKKRYSKDIGGFNRGYEGLRAQNFEKRAKGDLKEGFYIGRDLPGNHPMVLARRFGQGPNKYPTELADPSAFRETVDAYHSALCELATRILSVIARSLNIEVEFFSAFTRDSVATLRLLHYPPQDPDASELERGIGAHTDFGAVTILLQDMVGGLQVWSRDARAWVDVTPIPGAFVVNLGNLMMRWTNDKYLSNLHRVINKHGKDRYSVAFFLVGNPDYLVECLPGCRDEKEGAKYPPITVHDWMTGRYADTYGTSEGRPLAELSVAEVTEANV
ncbi:Oxoglutarate/iron-dependent dioxygenase [Pleurostoma richardsiae]|uniref:Oxoglutarate/iron-dependent dioxygenase n=1 Tax=Pleurostoma richardsiae TaxID=41990 RepID=A0AA38VCN4_9PEZI|nr:Oxoglutarate/iron-dependent dioxygenase [Pleurostoma richardsiae]